MEFPGWNFPFSISDWEGYEMEIFLKKWGIRPLIGDVVFYVVLPIYGAIALVCILRSQPWKK